MGRPEVPGVTQAGCARKQTLGWSLACGRFIEEWPWEGRREEGGKQDWAEDVELSQRHRDNLRWPIRIGTESRQDDQTYTPPAGRGVVLALAALSC